MCVMGVHVESICGPDGLKYAYMAQMERKGEKRGGKGRNTMQM